MPYRLPEPERSPPNEWDNEDDVPERPPNEWYNEDDVVSDDVAAEWLYGESK